MARVTLPAQVRAVGDVRLRHQHHLQTEPLCYQSVSCGRDLRLTRHRVEAGGGGVGNRTLSVFQHNF